MLSKIATISRTAEDKRIRIPHYRRKQGWRRSAKQYGDGGIMRKLDVSLRLIAHEGELMSSKEKAGFPIEENSDGSFSVNMDGNNVCVETEEEAKWLSMLPVELNNIFTNTPESPNVENIKEIITVCGEYNINSPAIRKLKNWIKKITQ